MKRQATPKLLKPISGKGRRFRNNMLNAAFAMGPTLGWILFGSIPLAISLYLSFTELHVSQLGSETWVGFENFIKLLTSAEDGGYRTRMLYAFVATLCCMISAPISIILSMFIANLLCKVKWAKRFFRSVFFIPYVCSASVVVIAFRYFFDSGSGVFNSILGHLGLQPVDWLISSPLAFYVCVTLMSVWSGLGNNIVLCMAAISNVDESYYEAARVDGASERRQFWQITLPAITPTLSYILTFSIIGAFQTTGPFLLAEGVVGCPYWMEGGAQVTEGAWVTIGYYIYRMMSVNQASYGPGIASAAGWILGALIFAITLINLKLQKKWVCYDF